MYQVRVVLVLAFLAEGWGHLLFYSPPPLFFQARLGGGFRAYLPDSPGVENFEFKYRLNDFGDWAVNSVDSKVGNHWIFEDPELLLRPGQPLFYSGAVTHGGNIVPIPPKQWVVPELVEVFSPPPLPPTFPQFELPKFDPFEEPTSSPTTSSATTPTMPTSSPTTEPTSTMANDQSTTTQDQNTTPSDSTTMKMESSSPMDSSSPMESTTMKMESTSPPASTTTTAASTTKKPTTTTKPTTTATPATSTAPPPPPSNLVEKKILCPWIDAVPNDTREHFLENSLGRLQCEMAISAQRTMRLNQQLNQELTDLKKLNYAIVARMQRLESLLRSLPRGLPSFPYL